jgi:hypothetical protein
VPPNRIVALFAPFIALAAGVAATWLTDHVSGLDVTPGQLEAIFIATLTAVLAPAAQWLHGSQKLAHVEAELERAALDADRRATELVLAEPYEPEDDDDYDEYEVDELGDDYEAARDEPDAVPAGA